jgi:hypothetical protein
MAIFSSIKSDIELCDSLDSLDDLLAEIERMCQDPKHDLNGQSAPQADAVESQNLDQFAAMSLDSENFERVETGNSINNTGNQAEDDDELDAEAPTLTYNFEDLDIYKGEAA